ncbi:MAG: recombinase family protein [Bacteroidetes bacterium]|nr:recombinase family protein [Bacteroidota bacterium]
MKKAVPYYRVSTERQGVSGLGLEAQQKAVQEYANAKGYKLIGEFIEVESGRNNKRPILHEALTECKNQKATLLIAKLDRLGRNVAFISALMESEVDFIAVDNPQANKLIVHIMAAFAEYERDQISTRTKEALYMAKKRGVKLGQYGKNVLAKKNKSDSLAFAKRMTKTITKLNKEGFETIREIRDKLNERNIPTYTGSGHWHVNTVHRLLMQIKSLKK